MVPWWDAALDDGGRRQFNLRGLLVPRQSGHSLHPRKLAGDQRFSAQLFAEKGSLCFTPSVLLNFINQFAVDRARWLGPVRGLEQHGSYCVRERRRSLQSVGQSGTSTLFQRAARTSRRLRRLGSRGRFVRDRLVQHRTTLRLLRSNRRFFKQE